MSEGQVERADKAAEAKLPTTVPETPTAAPVIVDAAPIETLPAAGGLLPTEDDEEPVMVDEHTSKLREIELAVEHLFKVIQSHLRGRHLAVVENKVEEALALAKHGLSKL